MALVVVLMGASACSTNDRSSLQGELGKRKQNEDVQQPTFAKGKELGALTDKRLKEVSGLAASVANPGLLWTHNDSGNEAEVYLIDSDTKIKQTYVLKGVSNRDWEEIALGPGPEPGKQYLYVGDIGDNMAAHHYKYIYRFEEPVLGSGSAGDKVAITKFETIVFSLPDERRDTEAFVVDPRTQDIYIISKWKDPVEVYLLERAALTGDTVKAKAVGTLPVTMVVAADFSADGSELLIKTYKEVLYWKRQGDVPVMSMLKEPATRLPYAREPQGEAIAWSVNGDGYYTLSEKKKGEKVHLLFYKRQ